MAERRLQIVLDVDTGQANARLTEAGRVVRDFGLNTQRSGQNLREMGRGFDSMHASMAQPIGKLRDYVLILSNLRLALLNMRDLTIGWVAGLVKQAAEMERLSVLMANFSKATSEAGKNEDAQRNLRNIMDLSNKTGFEMKAMTDAFVKFQSADLNPQVYSLRGLATAVAKFGGDSDTMHRASIAIQQMAGKGVISMEELRQQLGEAVPTAIKTLAASMGTTVADLTKKISQGIVQAKPALELMLRDMEINSAGAGERIANTLFGQIAQVKTGLIQLSMDFTGLGQQQGFFAGIVAQLKELNATMRSPEARQAMQELGNSVDGVATSLAGAIKWIIEWRSELGGVLLTALKVWAGIKAVQIGQWFAQMAQSAIISIRNVVSGTREMTGVSGQMYNWGTALKKSIDDQRQATQDWVTVARDRLVVAQQNTIATQLDVDVLRQKIAVLDQERIAAVAEIETQRQRVIGAQQAIMFAQRDIDMMGVTKARTDLLARSKTNLSMEITRLNELTANQSAIDVAAANAANELAVAEANLQRALMGEEAALGVVNVAERANAVSKGFMANAAQAASSAIALLQAALAGEDTALIAATLQQQAHAAASGLMATAARAAGAAVSFMGEMVNLALGPIGLFIIAAQTLSSWLNQTRVSADEAAQAMHRYVGAMATMESVKKAQSRIKDIDATLGDGADGFTMKTEIGMSAARRKQLEDERNQLRGYVTAESPNAYANFGRQQADQLGYERQNYRDRINAQKDFQDQYQALQAKALAGDKQAGQQLAALRDGQLAKERGWLADRINLTNRQLQQAQRIPDPAKRANTIAVLTARLGGLNQQMDTMGQQGANSADLITEALAGKGKNGKNTLSAADKAANRIAGLQGNIAALQAQVAGDKSTNLIKFMATLNSGGFRGKSPAEISLLRQQALLKDSVKGTEDARSANERYDSMMGQVTGRIAEMVAEMDGSAGNLAKFEARLKAATGADGSLGGAFKGFTPEKIAALRQAYQGQDETEHGKAIDGAFDKLSKEFVKADESSQALWESFKNGSIEADRHTDELRGRFMSIIDGLKLAPDELEKWKGKVDEIVNKMKENEGILEAFRLDQDTKKINNTLIGDERAQRIAETQREIDDEQSKIETALNAITGMDAESIKKRMRINAAFYDWKKAKEAELVRANESSTVKMMRQWAQLGNNMEQVLSGAISSFVDQLASGKLNVKDFAKEVLKELLKVILQALIAYAILSALGMTPTGSGGQPLSFGQYMGQSVSSGFGGGAAPTWEAPKHHDGGIIGTSKSFARVNSAMFDGAFKYHGGGVIDKLGPREVPMIGLEGERVLTEDDQRALAAGQKPNVTVNVINNSGEQLNADVGTEFNGKDMIISVVLDAMNKQGPLRDAMAGMHGK